MRGTKWAEVDVAALRENTAALLRLAGDGCAVMAMVKANGYGHGAVTAANAALEAGATWLGVSSISEALELRRAGIGARVLNVGWTMPQTMGDAVASDIDVAVFGVADVVAAREAARRSRATIRVHWKIDTGMGRLGTRLEQVDEVRRELVVARGDVEVAGIYTHFASADDASLDGTLAAHDRFMEVVGRVVGELGRPLLHCANSAAALRLPETRHDLIRPGIALYGYPPAYCAGLVPLRPAMRVYGLVTQVKEVVAGDRVGYGGEWQASRPARVATVALGYADGVDRRNANRGTAIVDGAPCSIIGRISMDQLSIDVSALPAVAAGQPVLLLGGGAPVNVDAAAIASSIGTIPYEVLCAVSSRVPRIAVNATGE